MINFIKLHQSNIVLGILVILITIISFNLGRIAERNYAVQAGVLKDGIEINEVGQKIGNKKNTNKAISSRKPANKDFSVVASKKSTTKSYHFSWCPGASRIVPENKLTFSDETAAIAAGFHLASNCTK